MRAGRAREICLAALHRASADQAFRSVFLSVTGVAAAELDRLFAQAAAFTSSSDDFGLASIDDLGMFGTEELAAKESACISVSSWPPGGADGGELRLSIVYDPLRRGPGRGPFGSMLLVAAALAFPPPGARILLTLFSRTRAEQPQRELVELVAATGAETVADLWLHGKDWFLLLPSMRRLRSLRVELFGGLLYREFAIGRDAALWPMLASAPASLRSLALCIDCMEAPEEGGLRLPANLEHLWVCNQDASQVELVAAAVARQRLQLRSVRLCVVAMPYNARHPEGINTQALGRAWAGLIDASADSLRAVAVGFSNIYLRALPWDDPPEGSAEEMLFLEPWLSLSRLPQLQELHVMGAILPSARWTSWWSARLPSTLRRMRLEVSHGAGRLPALLRAGLPPLEVLNLAIIGGSALAPRFVADAAVQALSVSAGRLRALHMHMPLNSRTPVTVGDVADLERALRDDHGRTLQQFTIGPVATGAAEGGTREMICEEMQRGAQQLAQVVGAFASRWDTLAHLHLYRADSRSNDTGRRRARALYQLRSQPHDAAMATVLAAVPGWSPLRLLRTESALPEMGKIERMERCVVATLPPRHGPSNLTT
jgi:hypothetical protein